MGFEYACRCWLKRSIVHALRTGVPAWPRSAAFCVTRVDFNFSFRSKPDHSSRSSRSVDRLSMLISERIFRWRRRVDLFATVRLIDQH
jgi:hypothetical protein